MGTVFTEDEQVVIRSLNPDIKYLARDMDGSLYGHSEKPLKQAAAWESIGNIYDLTPFTNVFQGITQTKYIVNADGTFVADATIYVLNRISGEWQEICTWVKTEG